MKKVIFLILLLIFIITGCGKTEVPKPTTMEIQEKVAAALKDNEKVNFDKIADFTCNEVKISENDYSTLKEKYASKVEIGRAHV